MSDAKKYFVDMLLKKGAIRIADNADNPFVFKSGRKSPNMVNLRAMTDGESQSGLKKAYATFIKQLLDDKKIEDFDFIFGPAYAAINLACLACEGLYEMYGLNKRYLFDRKESKGYGDMKMDDIIVGAGHFKKGSKILLIDDVITTGGTKLDSLEKLKVLGEHKIVGLVLAFDRQERTGDAVNVEDKSAIENIQAIGIPCFSIVNMQDTFSFVRDSLRVEIKDSWIDYYNRYGVVKLS